MYLYPINHKNKTRRKNDQCGRRRKQWPENIKNFYNSLYENEYVLALLHVVFWLFGSRQWQWFINDSWIWRSGKSPMVRYGDKLHPISIMGIFKGIWSKTWKQKPFSSLEIYILFVSRPNTKVVAQLMAT